MHDHTTLKRFFSACFLLCIIAASLTAISPAFANGNSALRFLLDDNNAESDTFLPPDEAFQLAIQVVNAKSLIAQFTVAPGHYLYRDRIQFTLNDKVNNTSANVPTLQVVLPEGEMKDDPNFGPQSVFHDDFTGQITLINFAQKEVSMTATYQGCSEKGLCYAPIKKILNINLQTPTKNINNPSRTNQSLIPSAENSNLSEALSENDQSTQLLITGNWWLIVAGFFGAGLLLSLTPCVLPMIPILSSIIVGTRKNMSKSYTFGLSVAYVLGMAFSYTLAGIAAGLSGNLLSQSLQNPWVLGTSSFIFVLLALSMFGFYEIRLPQRFEDEMVNKTNRFKGGQILGVFSMGAISALIVSPCVAAPLAGALIYISQTQNVVLGGVALFALSIGMGVPLLLIGASAGQILPKTGPWMSHVRNFFGVLMIGMAIWLVSPVLPHSLTFVLWASLLIITAVYLNALDPLPNHQTPYHHKGAQFWKGIGIVLLVLGISLMIGSVSGAKSLLQPLAGILSQTNQSSENKTLQFSRISNLDALNASIANAQGKPVMLDFYADWCVACKELEAYTFSDAAVQKKLQDALLLQVDVTQNTAEDQALLKRFALFGPPGIIFFDANGQEMPTMKTIGFQNAATFLNTLSRWENLR